MRTHLTSPQYGNSTSNETSMDDLASREQRSVTLGALAYELRCDNPKWLKDIVTKFDTSKRPIRRRLTIKGSTKDSLSKQLPAGWTYNINWERSGETRHFTGPEFSLRFDLSSDKATLNVDPNLDLELYVRPIENALRILCAYDSLELGGLMLHSAGLVYKNKAQIFVGQSGAGKSTLCGTAFKRSDVLILSDEINLIMPQQNEFICYSMPFAGDFGGVGSAPYPIERIGTIEQSKTSQLSKLSKHRLIAKMIANTPFVNADPTQSDALWQRSAEVASQLPHALFKLQIGDTPWTWEKAPSS